MGLQETVASFLLALSLALWFTLHVCSNTISCLSHGGAHREGNWGHFSPACEHENAAGSLVREQGLPQVCCPLGAQPLQTSGWQLGETLV